MSYFCRHTDTCCFSATSLPPHCCTRGLPLYLTPPTSSACRRCEKTYHPSQHDPGHHPSQHGAARTRVCLCSTPHVMVAQLHRAQRWSPPTGQRLGSWSSAHAGGVQPGHAPWCPRRGAAHLGMRQGPNRTLRLRKPGRGALQVQRRDCGLDLGRGRRLARAGLRRGRGLRHAMLHLSHQRPWGGLQGFKHACHAASTTIKQGLVCRMW